MTDELKPVRCGCGGEAHVMQPSYTHCHVVMCPKCGIKTAFMNTEAEAIEAWNRAMGERKAKVVSIEKPIIGDAEGKTIRVTSCSACENTVSIFDDFCPGCGARLEWNE